MALDKVAIRLQAGEILGLVGPNGAGKTTLVDVISGAQVADGGALVLREHPLHGSAARRAGLGIARTFQSPQLARELSVRDNLLVGRVASRHRTIVQMIMGSLRGVWSPRSAADDRAIESIADEILLSELDRAAGDLSLGEQRLVEVGRALAQDPVVMLLDEPFAGSDPQGVAGISEVVRTVGRRGHGVILVDHNVDLVTSLVDRVMLLDRGHVVFDGDPGECLSSAEMRRVYFGSGGSSGGEAGDRG